MAIKEFIELWERNKPAIRAVFEAAHPDDYEAIVKTVIENIQSGGYDDPDPERITSIDHGDYQGTLVFVIGAKGYQPDTYWYVKVGYGSCSSCDTLQDIRGYGDEKPTRQQVDDYMTLAMHIVQGLKKMGDD